MTLTTLSKIPDFLFTVFFAVLSFLTPMIYSWFFLVVLIVVDLISGILLAQHNGENFKLKKLMITGRKIIYYTLISFSGYIIDSVFIKESFGVVFFYHFFMFFLAIAEFKSIIDNLSRLLKIDIWNVVIKAFKKNNIEIDE